MTSLHPAATDPSLPGPPRDSAGSSPPPAPTGPPGSPGSPVPMCSIATATEPGAAAPGTPEATARPDSVPQPRSRYDAEAPPVLPAAAPEAGGGPADGDRTDGDPHDDDPTTARLRAAFAERLRAAHFQGRSVAELAAACRRPVAEVRALLGLDAEAEDGFVRFGPATATAEGGPSVPAQRPAHEEPRILGSRRPSPSRRLRRMHPQASRTGQEATARETAASGPTGPALPGATGRVGEPADAAEVAARTPSFGTGIGGGAGAAAPSAVDTGAVDAAAVGPAAAVSWAEPPLGILIGGSPGPAEALGRPEERAPVRVAAQPIRVGRGTCLVVLPSWRPAIAVSVPTEQLLSATGLDLEQLAGAQLTVLMNPAALHDRELELHGWEPGPAGRPRRGGRT
ncbi:hypothetical protein ACFY4B_15210 [Kitasatospora sp. NPDC001261]|uniref:hypothetical protein n=1 Tax=Kitasatospora sp. NPDC001261 TaxID=3364012 RepID=UPI00369B3099